MKKFTKPPAPARIESANNLTCGRFLPTCGSRGIFLPQRLRMKLFFVVLDGVSTPATGHGFGKRALLPGGRRNSGRLRLLSVSPAPGNRPLGCAPSPSLLNSGWSVFGDHRWSIFGCHFIFLKNYVRMQFNDSLPSF